MTDVFIDHSAEVLRSANNEIEKAIAIGTIKVQNESKRLVNQFSGPPIGPPSKPGEPPHKRTGTLDRSIDMETFTRGRDFVGRVGTNLNYGLWLEIGTSKMLARPYLRTALDNMRKAIIRAINRAGKRMGRTGKGS